MVDVLINCLLKNKEIVEELATTAPSGSERSPDMPDGEESWRAFYEHPLTAATTAMLNIGGQNTEDQNATTMGLLCEYYKLPLEKMDKALMDKYGALPDFWTTVAANGQIGNVTNGTNAVSGTLPVSLLPQAAGILRNRRISDPNDVAPQEVDIYLNRGLIKREIHSEEELIVPTSGVLNMHKSDRSATKVPSDGTSSDNDSPLPMIVEVKQERSPELPTSPSPPTSKARELPPASTVIAQAYSTHVFAQNYETLASQYTTAAPPQYQSQPTTSVYMVTAPSDYRALPDYYTEQIRHNLATTVSTVPAYADASDTAAFVDRYIRQATGLKGTIHGLTVDLPSPDSGIGDTTITPRDAANLSQVGEIFDYSDITQAQVLLQTTDPSTSRPASSQSGST